MLLPSCLMQLKFMWGNLAVGSGDRWREVSVPFLQPGQVRGLDFYWFVTLKCSANAVPPLKGWHRECGTGRSLCGGILHLPLAPGTCWGAVWTQGLVQYCGGSLGPCSCDGWWGFSVALCDTTGRPCGYRNNKNHLVALKRLDLVFRVKIQWRRMEKPAQPPGSNGCCLWTRRSITSPLSTCWLHRFFRSLFTFSATKVVFHPNWY